MSGRRINGGRGGCGYTKRVHRHRHGQGHNYSGASNTSKKGLCIYLGNNVFNYGHKAKADQIRTSWKKLVQQVGTKYG